MKHNFLTRGFSYIQLAEDLKTQQHYAIKRLLAQEDDQVSLIKDEVSRLLLDYCVTCIIYTNFI